jgi:hypothetical protein
MTARVQERIKREAKQWFADYGINMALYDRGFMTHEEGDVSCSVSFKRLDGKDFELVADDVFFDEKGGVLECELILR